MTDAFRRLLPRRLPFVAREEQLAQLTALLDEARAGRGSFVLLAGEPGIGKSRLADEVAQAARSEGFACLAGNCYEGSSAAPYIAFVEVLDAAVRSVPGKELPGLAAGLPGIERLAPRLRGLSSPPSLDAPPAENERHDLFNAVRDFLARLSARAPVLVLIEDLHWAEAPTVLLLKHLSQSLEGQRVVLLCTIRDEDLDVLSGDDGGAPAPAAALVDDLHRMRFGHHLKLPPLDQAGVAALLRGITGRDPPDSIARAVYRHTEGNPLFVEEVTRHLVEEGRLIVPDGTWRDDLGADDLGVPEGVRRVLGRRLDRVSAGCRQALTAAAIIGRTFHYELLREVAGQPPDALLDSIDEAERARLIVSGQSSYQTRLSFRHELIRQTLLSQVSLPRRQQIHLRVLRALEAAPAAEGRAGDLAYHSLRAGAAADRDETIAHVIRAADREAGATGYEEASRLYREALRLLSPADAARRCDLLLRLGLAEKRVSDSEEARAVFHEAAVLARRLGDAEKLAHAALGFARSWPTVGVVDGPAVQLLRDALEMSEALGPAVRAEMTSRLALQLFYSGSGEVQALARRAVEIARAADDPAALARTLQTMHVTLWAPEHIGERLAAASEILEIAERARQPQIEVMGRRPRIADLLEAGDTEAAEADLEAYVPLAAETRQPIYVWQAAVRRAMFALFRGRLVEGERLAGEALTLGQRAGGQNLVASFGLQMLVTRWMQGRLPELLSLATASVARQPDLALWRAVLAFIQAEMGDLRAARENFGVLSAEGFAALPMDDTRTIAAALAAHVCATLEDAPAAKQLYDELSPRDGLNIVFSEGVVCVGAASHRLGMLAATFRDWQRAEAHLRAAIEMNRRTGGRPWLALTQFDYAKMLLARRAHGDRKAALDLLSEAQTAARELGLRAVEDAAGRLLASHRKVGPQFPDGLTRREAEVLRLLAAGRSNKEISEALVLSLRTTARHVTNIYGKIGARNRADATAYAIRNGLAQQ